MESPSGTKQSQKRVQLSLMASNDNDELPRLSVNEDHRERKSDERETFVDFLTKNTSTRTSCISDSSNRLPNLLLDHLNDKKLLLKYVRKILKFCNSKA